MLSTSTDELDDFDLVALGEAMVGVRTSWEHVTVHLHRDPPGAEPELIDELGDRDAFGKLARFAVHHHAHVRTIDASWFLYNKPVIWFIRVLRSLCRRPCGEALR